MRYQRAKIRVLEEELSRLITENKDLVCLLPSSACSQREGGWELGSADASAPLSPRGSQTRTLRADKQKYSADSQELGAQQRKVHVLQVRPTHATEGCGRRPAAVRARAARPQRALIWCARPVLYLPDSTHKGHQAQRGGFQEA